MQMSKEVHILKLDDILPNRFQPRIVFDETAINELTESIKEYGVIEPIIVRKVADKYEIIAGERRYKASVLAGRDTIPAIITDLNDKDSAEIALIENVQRQNLTPIEEAVSYKKILDMGYMNQSELASKLGKTQSTVANKLRLLNLTDTVQEALLQERISERHARSLLRLPQDKQDSMLDKIIKERMTVRKTDEEINKILEGNTPNEKIPAPVVEPTEKKEEKEEINMNNNDFTNQFNIPTSPIIETPPTVEPQNVQPVQPVVPNAPQIQPTIEPINLESPSIIPVVENTPISPVQPVNTVNHEPIQQQMNVVEPVVPQRAQSTVVEQPVPVMPQQPEQNMDPMNFMPNSISNDPVVGNTQEVLSSVQQPQTINHEPANETNDDTPISGRFFNMFGEEPVESETPVAGQPVPVMPQQPEQNMNSTVDFNPFGMAATTPVVENTPIAPVQPVTSEPIPMPTVPIEPEMSVPTPQPTMIDPIQPYQLNDNQEFTNSSVVELGTLGSNRTEEPTLQPLMEDTQPKIKVEMKEIINMIRNCADQIEKCGYAIDTDELDFDDHYQVVFKIDKMN
jgi:ParB family chromosome partitioning protein